MVKNQDLLQVGDMCFEILDKDNKTKQITIQTNAFLGEIEREGENL